MASSSVCNITSLPQATVKSRATSWPAINRVPPRLPRVKLVCRANEGGNDGAQRGVALSPDVQELFDDARRSIQELNNSRLQALQDLQQARQELKQAHDRVTQLEVELSTAQQAAAEAQAAASQAASQAAAGSSSRSYGTLPPQKTGNHSNTGNITILYETGWNNANIHYNADGKGWTKSPGVQMAVGRGERAGMLVTVLVGARRVEFVTNSGDEWDRPDPFGPERKNYVANGPGVYRLKNGRLTKLE